MPRPALRHVRCGKARHPDRHPGRNLGPAWLPPGRHRAANVHSTAATVLPGSRMCRAASRWFPEAATFFPKESAFLPARPAGSPAPALTCPPPGYCTRPAGNAPPTGKALPSRSPLPPTAPARVRTSPLHRNRSPPQERARFRTPYGVRTLRARFGFASQSGVTACLPAGRPPHSMAPHPIAHRHPASPCMIRWWGQKHSGPAVGVVRQANIGWSLTLRSSGRVFAINWKRCSHRLPCFIWWA